MLTTKAKTAKMRISAIHRSAFAPEKVCIGEGGLENHIIWYFKPALSQTGW